jgi:nucleoside-diphosphate-sugar epimerase
LVTGAGGFIGSKLCDKLQAAGYETTALTRAPSSRSQVGVRRIAFDLSSGRSLNEVLKGQEAIVHLAGLAHGRASTLQQYRAANRDATITLATAAGDANVRHFVYFSSIGVNGPTSGSSAFSELSEPRPTQGYAVSKLEAERLLGPLAKSSGMALTIIRPPLVYGAGASGNVLRLLRLVRRGVPLPFAGVGNRRSFVSRENLADFVAVALRNRAEANGLFLVADDEVVSTADVVLAMGRGMGRSPTLFHAPAAAVAIAVKLPGIRGIATRLYNSLEVDNSRAKQKLNWEPAERTIVGLEAMAAEFLQRPW